MKLIPTALSPMFASNKIGRLALSRSTVAIALVACSLSLIGCSTTNASAPPPATTPAPVASEAPASPNPTPVNQPKAEVPVSQPKAEAPVTDLEPEIGTVKAIQQGDLMCYITFIDEAGKERTEGATFELCEKSGQYLNQRLRLIYGVRNVSDCQSNEPCGKTRRANVVIKLDRIDAAAPTETQDRMVLKNSQWTIEVGNMNSWSGVNNTGDLTYRGCNSQQECLELAQGKMSCRDGMCGILWVNGDYSYNLRFPMTNPDQPGRSPATLVVARGGKELQQIQNLR